MDHSEVILLGGVRGVSQAGSNTVDKFSLWEWFLVLEERG